MEFSAIKFHQQIRAIDLAHIWVSLNRGFPVYSPLVIVHSYNSLRFCMNKPG